VYEEIQHLEKKYWSFPDIDGILEKRIKILGKRQIADAVTKVNYKDIARRHGRHICIILIVICVTYAKSS
jgi:hypothetical protein